MLTNLALFWSYDLNIDCRVQMSQTKLKLVRKCEHRLVTKFCKICFIYQEIMVDQSMWRQCGFYLLSQDGGKSICMITETSTRNKLVEEQHFRVVPCQLHAGEIVWSSVGVTFVSSLLAGKAVSWALLNPSVSPFRSTSNGLRVESSNPAVRLYRYDTMTGHVSPTKTSANLYL